MKHGDFVEYYGAACGQSLENQVHLKISDATK